MATSDSPSSIGQAEHNDSAGAPRGVWRCYVAAAVLIAAGLVATFWWMVSDPNAPRFLGASDAWLYSGPAQFFLDNRLHAGELPLWNCLSLCGEPFAANPSNLVFYPPNLLRSLLNFSPTPFKTHVSILLMVFLHLMFSGLCTFALARHHRLSLGASITAAIVYVLSAPSATRGVGHWNFHNVLAWLPLLILLLRLGLDAVTFRHKVSFGILGGLVLGMMALGGVPQLLVLAVMMVAAYWIIYRLIHFCGTPIRELRRPGALLLGDLAMMALLGAIAVCIACASLLPAQELSSFSARAGKSIHMGKRLDEPSAWPALKNLIVYSGEARIESIKAAGVTALLLALLAMTGKRFRDVLLYGLLGILFLDCSLDMPVFFGWVVTWLAPFKIDQPGRAMALACLPLGLLAGIGLDAATMSLATVRARMVRSLIFLAVGMALLGALLVWAHPHPYLSPSLWVFIMPALAILAVIAAGWWHKPLVWGAVIAALCFGETLAWNKQLLPHIVNPGSQFKEAMSTLHEAPPFWNDNRRTSEPDPNVNMYRLKAAINGYNPLYLNDVRTVICSHGYENTYLRMVWSWEPAKDNNRGGLFLKRPFWLASHYVAGPLPSKDAVFPSVNTVFIEEGDAAPVPRIERAALPNSAVSERAVQTISLVSEAHPVDIPVVRDNNNQRMFSAEHLRLPPIHAAMRLTVSADCAADLQTVYVYTQGGQQQSEIGWKIQVKANEPPCTIEAPLPDSSQFDLALMPQWVNGTGTIRVHSASILVDPADEDRLIRVVSRTANTVDLETPALPGPRVLTFVDAHYPGWRATVDGEEVPILRANEAFKAVVLQSGPHHVRFVFSSSRVYIGMAVSLAALLACLFALGGLTLRRKGV